jgi:fibronectin type 3 domain-containing protein
MSVKFSFLLHKLLLIIAAITAFSSTVHAAPFIGNLKLLIIRGVYMDTVAESDSAMLAKYPDQVMADVVNGANDFYLKRSWGNVGVDSIGSGSSLVAGCPVIPSVDTNWYADLQIVGEQMAVAQGYNPQNYDIVLVLWNCMKGSGAQTHAQNRIYFQNNWSTATLCHELRHALLMKAGQPSWEACGWYIDSGKTNPLEPAGAAGGYWDVPDIGGVLNMGIDKLDLNACTKNELGWTTASEVFAVQGNQDYMNLITLYPIDSEKNPNALSAFSVARNCMDPANPDLQQVLWGEFRTRYTGIPSIENGILIHLAPCDWNPISTTLLDMSMRVKNPPYPFRDLRNWGAQTAYLNSYDGKDVGLSVGRTFNDYQGKIHITPFAVTSNPKTMSVFVTTGDFANDNSPNGHVTFSGNIINDTTEGITYPNRPIWLNANGTDPDNDALAYYWTFGDGTHSTNNSMVVQHTWTDTGTYTVWCEISDMKGMMALARGTVNVYDTPPIPPSNVSCSYVTPYSGSRVQISWSDNDPSIVGYRVVRMDKNNNILGGVNVPSGAIFTCIDKGLVANTQYNYKVQAYNAKNYSSDFSNTAAIITMALPPDAPDNLMATVASSSQIYLTWNDNDNIANETGYVFKIAAGDSAFKDWGNGSAGMTSLTVGSLAPNTSYRFEVCAYNSFGSSCSNIVTAKTLIAVPSAPVLSGSAISARRIDLSWPAVPMAVYYTLDVSLTAAGPFSTLMGTAGTTFSDTSAMPNTQYYFRVMAGNVLGNSPYSNVLAVKTPDVLPPAPLGLKATAVSSTQINLSWTDTASNETGFYIEKAASSAGPFTQIATVGANVTTYSNTGLTPNVTNWYRVRAYNGIGNSGYSNIASATTPMALSAPSNLGASLASPTSITLWWNDNSSNETGFYIEQATSATGPWTQVGSTSANNNHFTTGTNLAPLTTYWYRVRAYDAVEASGYTNTASVTTQDVPPTAPSTMAATTVSSNQINLSWKDNANNETGFYLESSTSANGSWNQIAILGANVTSYSNTGLAAGTTFWYRVRAYNNIGISAYSNSATASTPAVSFPDPNKWYKIAAMANSAICLDVTGGSYANNTAIELWTKTNVNQEFQFKNAGNGYYTITCRGNTGYSIDMSGNFANNQTLKLWSTDVNNPNQKFKPVSLTGGYYRLESSNSGFSIDNGGTVGNGSKPLLWTSDNNNNNQKWVITEVK